MKHETKITTKKIPSVLPQLETPQHHPFRPKTMTSIPRRHPQQRYNIPKDDFSDLALPLYLIALPPLRSANNIAANDVSSPANTHQSGDDTDNDNEVDILAYGGEDGKLWLLPPQKNCPQNKPMEVAQFRELVRSIAISSDGLRIAIGFEDGPSKIYSFDEIKARNGVDKLGRVHHPFIDVKMVDKGIDGIMNGDGDSLGEEGEGFFTQTQGDDDKDKIDQGDHVDRGIQEFDGPRFNATIRHMAFDPRSSSKHYYLAMVSESSDSPLRVANVYDESTSTKWYLEQEGCDYHGGAGVRSVAYSPPNDDDDNKMWLTTLSMEGKLNVWDVSSPLSLPDNWEHVHSDFVQVISQDTPSQVGSSDAGDRASHLIWGMVAIADIKRKRKAELLLLPGRTDVQVRVIPSSSSYDDDFVMTCFKKQQFVMDLDKGHKDNIVAMAFEPLEGGSISSSSNENDKICRRRVVTAARDGKLLLWEMTLDDNDDDKMSVTGSLVKELPMVRGITREGIPVITSIVWSGDVLYVAHADGEISVVSVSAPALTEDEVQGSSTADEAIGMVGGEEAIFEEDELLSGGNLVTFKAKGGDDGVEESSKVKATSRVFDDDDDDDDEDDDDDVFRRDEEVAEMAQKGKQAASKFIDDEAEAEDDDAANFSSAEKDTVKLNGGDDDSDDDKTQPVLEEDNIDDHVFDNHNDPFEFGENGDGPNATNFSFPPLQPAFAPSSTPIGDSRRILCWNHMGVVTLRPDVEIDGNNLVDISFHDNAGLAGGSRPITFTDNVGFIVGTLGDDGGLFASDLMEDEDDDDDFDVDGLTAGLSEATRKAVKRSRKKLNGSDSAKGSSVYFHRFETFGKTSDKDWVYALPDGERVLGCAAGSGWCGVMTSRRFLRLFTVGGIQGPIIWLPGEPVTIVGRGRFVAVIYHRSMSPMQDGTQLLGYSIIDGVNGRTVATGDVSALSPGASLTWAGFTESCALTVMDSDGMLSLLARPNNESSSFGNWVPFLDTVGLKKSISDNFWPVEVNGGRLVCVLLRGGKEHPDVSRRPVTTTLKLRMPMATCLSMKSGAEEEASVRANIALDQRKLHDDILVSAGKMNSEDVEEEYDMMCRQVDKITLKLFNTFITARKVERALDLASRFHTEKTYDIAITAADRMGLGRLCERIEELKNQKFPPIDENSDEESYDSGVGEKRNRIADEPRITSRQQLMEMQRISPDALHTPQKGRSTGDGHSTDEESPPAESLKRKFDGHEASKTSKMRVNPFVKKHLESPAKGVMKLPLSPTRPTLSKAKYRQNARR